MTTSSLQRCTSDKLSIYFGGYTIRENIRPEWLQNEAGNRLELDFLIEEIDVAIEVQGSQHYQYSEYFHGTSEAFADRLRWDRHKVVACSERGISLFEVSNEDDLDAVLLKISQIAVETRSTSDNWVTTPTGNPLPLTKKEFYRVMRARSRDRMRQYEKQLAQVRKQLQIPLSDHKRRYRDNPDIIGIWKAQERRLVEKMASHEVGLDRRIHNLYLSYISGYFPL